MLFGAKPVTQIVNAREEEPSPHVAVQRHHRVRPGQCLCEACDEWCGCIDGLGVEGRERIGYLSGGATVAERDVVCEGEAMCCSLSALISRLQYLSPLRDPLHLSMNPITEKTNQSVPVREGRILHL